MNYCTFRRAVRWRAVRASIVLFVLLMMAPAAFAQRHSAPLTGRVVTEAGHPAAGVAVSIQGHRLTVETDADGVFRFTAAPATTVTLVIDQIGWRMIRRQVTLTAGTETRLDLVLYPAALLLDEVVVTTSREAQLRAETPATIHGIGKAEIERLKPAHPSELMNRIPGVWVNVTGGEGHMAAIRHPLTTSPVYLYLENGVPTRSTGFFNHNALYEIDVPHAGRVEVVKGPATALYGSDAIGGMVNVLSRSAHEAPPVTLSLEGGAFGFGRALLSASTGSLLTELNVTRTDGWRSGTGYDRQSGSLRWEHSSRLGTFRPMVAWSRIDQSTAGTSSISEDDFRTSPTRNYTPISYREVQAVRASVAWEQLRGSTLLSVTPFMRWNRMELLPNWTLTYDPHISRTGHASAGALLKLRHDLTPLRTRIVTGIDLDYSPGTHREWTITAARDAGVFTSYDRGALIYDYDVAFSSVSPYTQLEISPTATVRVVGGLRYDRLGYAYDNALGILQEGSHRRPGDTNVTYERLSPKLGVIWAPRAEFRVFANYGHGFRAPSEGQLFRQGRAESTLALRPVRARNVELGAGGVIAGIVSYDVAVYRMSKLDDILAFTREDGSAETMNAGETLHRGIEVGAAAALPWDLRVDATFSNARHSYVTWTPRAGTDYSGNTMESAPERTASAGITWTPRALGGANLGVDAHHIGPFWMDAANTRQYEGHTTMSIRGTAPLTRRVELFARVSNVLDERYAEMAQYTAARGAEYAPGLPRSLYVGARYR
jgi:iron complex outermembrane recepter protein